MKIDTVVMALATAVLVGCGGGGNGEGDPAPPPPAGPTDAQRSEAARVTANGNAACTAVAPFYWEIGNRNAAQASGAVNRAGNATSYSASTVMPIASASKWLFGAYVAERRAGVLTADDVRFLNFRSGYSNFNFCLPGQTVDGCLAVPASNGSYSAASDGKFLYDGGHMQKLASLIGLGAMDNSALAAEMRSRLGNDFALAYSQPQLAGGGVTSAADYARFLRHLLEGSLRLSPLLGTQAVCTNPLTCATALGTPVPTTESWHYSLGHWIEDDPVLGDGAVSSPGAFGFYPWIDATRTTYGILARQDAAGSGEASVACGRLIRKAWVTATAQ